MAIQSRWYSGWKPVSGGPLLRLAMSFEGEMLASHTGQSCPGQPADVPVLPVIARDRSTRWQWQLVELG